MVNSCDQKEKLPLCKIRIHLLREAASIYVRISIELFGRKFDPKCLTGSSAVERII
jgi:hypothetical protein